MDEKKYNDEIEILDGLDDLFTTPKEEKEEIKTDNIFEPTFTFDDELLNSSKDEVFDVLNEPIVDMNKIKEESKVIKENPFSTFTPDRITINEQSQVVKEPEVKEPVVESIKSQEPTMDEIFYMNFDEETPKVEENVVEEQNNTNIFDIETSVNEVPVDNVSTVNDSFDDKSDSFSVEQPVEEQEVDLEKTNFHLDEVLKPIDLTAQINVEEIKAKSNSSLFDENIKLEPVEEKNNFDINYNFAEQNDTKDTTNLDEAFKFEANETKENNFDGNKLGETVIIEPVELKPVEKNDNNTDKKEEPKQEETKALEVVETTKKEPKKKDGRMLAFILLVVLLLISIIALFPAIIEKFAL